MLHLAVPFFVGDFRAKAWVSAEWNAPILRVPQGLDGESASLEDFGGGDALVEEMLDDGAGDSGEQEFGGEGEVI